MDRLGKVSSVRNQLACLSAALGSLMMAVQWIGRFRELADCHDDPSILDSVDKSSPTEASVVAGYLRSGHGLIDVMEIRADVVDGTRIGETASVLGDGQWIWREDLAHYVEKFRVALDPSFLRSIKQPMASFDEGAMTIVMQDAMRLWKQG